MTAVQEKWWTKPVSHRIGAGFLAAALFTFFCHRYDVVQDDAVISMVYAKNFAAGDGLVFNLGQRVEGYTNFLWVVLLAIPHAIGVDAIVTARICGVLSAIALLFLSWRLSSAVSSRPRDWIHLATPCLLATNGALAFWTLSGMETTTFAMVIAAAALRYLRTGRLDAGTGLLFGISALIRPEGSMFFALTVLHQVFHHVIRERPVQLRTLLRASNAGVLCFACLVVPHILFRWLYYGFFLPNTFYAKTGISITYLTHGLRYTGGFLASYGLYGLLPFAALLLIRRHHTRGKVTYLALLTAAYGIYVTLVGGDALAENRLFVPILALLMAPFTEAVRVMLLRMMSQRHAGLAQVAITAATMAFSVVAADAGLLHARDANVAHNAKLETLADYIRSEGGTDLIASTAVGIPRYRTQANVLDLVGLTDSMVAHHPVRLPGIRDDHILSHYNTEYVLGQAPDLFMFVAGSKPTTPAGRSLFLSRRFRRNYYTTYLQGEFPVFLRRDSLEVSSEEIFPDGRFVELYVEALSTRQADPGSARDLLRRSIGLSPPDFAEPHYWLGRLYFDENQIKAAENHFRDAVTIDDHSVMALAHIAFIEMSTSRADSAIVHATRAQRLAPNSLYCNYTLGRALIAAQRFEDAVAVLQRAASLGGTQQDYCLYWLGVAALASDDVAGARRAWTRLLEISPGNDAATRALALLGA
ncbi:MAG: tetratricopeptide repeat protein [bacterium]|nr:tetratricopeptide repeat protein [bacterium]